jgi:hypothetical protein
MDGQFIPKTLTVAIFRQSHHPGPVSAHHAQTSRTPPLPRFLLAALATLLLLPTLPAHAQANIQAAIDDAPLPEVTLPAPPPAVNPAPPKTQALPSADPIPEKPLSPPSPPTLLASNPLGEKNASSPILDFSTSILPPSQPPPILSATTPPVAALSSKPSNSPPPANPNPPAPAAETLPATRPAAALASPIEDKPIRPSARSTSPTADSANSPAVPISGSSTSGWKNVEQTAAALAIVIGLIFIGRALVRKFVPGAKSTNGKGVIEILARHPLSKNQSIVLVRIGSQIVAMNQGKDASQSVLVISDPAEVAGIIGQIEGKSPNSIQAGFNRLLANARVDLESEPAASEDQDLQSMDPQSLDEQLDEMAAAKRQLMELRHHVRTVRDSLPIK